MYDADKDQNWEAYQSDLREGKLELLKGQYVAYHGGKLVASASSAVSLSEKIIALDQEGIIKGGSLIHKVGEELNIIRIRRPRRTIIE